MTRFLLALAILALTVAPAAAAGIEIGDKAPAFSGLKGVDDETHSLKDYKKDALVVCITCNHCPVAIAYEDRMIDFVKNHGEKVDFVAINVNNNDRDKLDKMVERAKEKGFNFDYLYDPSQKVATQLGAKVTPHFFVFDKERKLVYAGPMDDSNSPKKAKENYLVPAVTAALKGEKPETSEISVRGRGCGIQWERK